MSERDDSSPVPPLPKGGDDIQVEVLLPDEENSKRSRASFRTLGRRSSRSGSRVSIERNSQTQQEVNEATQKIRTTEGGIPLCAYFKWLTDSTGQVVDLTAIANNIDLELERTRQNYGRNTTSRTQSLPPHPSSILRETNLRKEHDSRSREDLAAAAAHYAPTGRSQIPDNTFPSSVKSPDNFLPGESSISDH